MRMAQPLLPGRSPTPGSTGGPECFEFSLHQVDRHQRLVGRQQILQADLLFRRFQVLRIAQQQPSRLLDNLAGRLVVTQPVSLVDADPINHLSAIFGHHMEEVVDHSRVGTVLTNLQVKSGVHVHRHRFDSSTTLWPQFFEERPDRCSAATFTDPQHSPCIRI
ncbi:hypothetical protein D3C75_790170 [compost metagenome]